MLSIQKMSRVSLLWQFFLRTLGWFFRNHQCCFMVVTEALILYFSFAEAFINMTVDFSCGNVSDLMNSNFLFCKIRGLNKTR